MDPMVVLRCAIIICVGWTNNILLALGCAVPDIMVAGQEGWEWIKRENQIKEIIYSSLPPGRIFETTTQLPIPAAS